MNLFLKICFTITILLICREDTLAQWSQLRGPLGGAITCSGGRGNVLIAGCTPDLNNYCQLFRSIDYGNTWEAVFDIENSLFQSVTFLDSAIYVCALDSGIFVSYDDGLTWQNSTSSLTNTYFTSATVCDNRLFACGNGIYMTDNGGVSWMSTSSGISPQYVLDIAADSMALYAINSIKIYKSNDHGQTWQVINNGIIGTNFLQIAANDSNLIVSTFSSGVYLSNNLGQTWSNIGFNGFEARDVGFRGDTLMVAINDSIYYSNDDGVNWSSSTSVLGYNYINQFSSYGSEILIASLGGLYFMQNLASSWDLIGVPALAVVSMGGFGNVLFAGTYDELGPSAGIVVSKDNGETWTSANNGLPGAGLYTSKAKCFLGFGNIILTSWRNDGLFLSNDTGSTWQHCLNGIPATAVSALTMYLGIIYAMNDSGQIYSSSDSAQTWSLFSSIPFAPISMSYRDIEFRDSIIYVSTSGNLGICISYDFGQTWGTSNIGLTCLNIWSMAIKDNMIALGTQPDGLFLSNNYGMSWSHVNLGQTSPWITSLAISNDTIFAGTSFSQGVMISADWGNTWSLLNDGLYGNNYILSILKFYANDDFLYVSIGSYRSRFSIYMRPINQITNLSELPLIRNELEIHPNPNKGNFTILAPASVFGNDPVIVSVFDISGRIIFKKSINTDEEFISDELNGKRGLFICTATSSKITRNKRVVVY